MGNVAACVAACAWMGNLRASNSYIETDMPSDSLPIYVTEAERGAIEESTASRTLFPLLTALT
jgi:hypothetical protein